MVNHKALRIYQQSWYAHFRNVFSTANWGNDDSNTLPDHGLQPDSDKFTETDDYRLNSPIREKEISDAIHKLNVSKSSNGELLTHHIVLYVKRKHTYYYQIIWKNRSGWTKIEWLCCIYICLFEIENLLISLLSCNIGTSLCFLFLKLEKQTC